MCTPVALLTYRWAHVDAASYYPHVLAPLSASCDVCDDGEGEGNSAAATSALNHAQDEERRIVSLEGKSDVGAEIDAKG